MQATVPPTPETVPPFDRKHIDNARSPGWLEELEERIGRVPVLGSAVADFGWSKRMAPVVRLYERQLRARPENVHECWAEGESRRVAQVVCRILKRQICWPNGRFVPWDPVNVACWAHVDGLDDYVALLDIADEFDVEEFTEDEFLGIFGMTLGELLQLLMSRPARSPKPRRKWGFQGRLNV